LHSPDTKKPPKCLTTGVFVIFKSKGKGYILIH
jgi:hypothetical protein